MITLNIPYKHLYAQEHSHDVTLHSSENSHETENWGGGMFTLIP